MDAPSALMSTPLSAEECDHHFAGLRGHRLLMAVSGGPDSVAMMGLVADWAARHRQPAPAVAVVDHGLRAGAASEAEAVVTAANALGLPTARLQWSGSKPTSGVQDAARVARYRLLVDHARTIGATVLLTAHTRDDQAETLLMRLSRGSGLSGMSGMRLLGQTGGLPHARPLLDVAKERLVVTCGQRGWPFFNDPSNVNPRFARTRWRRIMPALHEQGLTAERLATFARRMAQADAALDIMTQATLKECSLDASGHLWRLDARKLFATPVAIQIRVLEDLVGGGHAAAERSARAELRLQRIETCVTAFQTALSHGTTLRRSLGRQVLTLTKDAVLSAVPEATRRRGASTLLSDSALATGGWRTT